MEIDEALKQGCWAIVHTATARYVGQLWGIDHAVAPKSESYFIEHMLNPVRMRWPFELIETVLPYTHPLNPDELCVPFAYAAVPVGGCLCTEETAFILIPHDLLFFSSMADSDRRWHEELIKKGIREARRRLELRSHKEENA
jgi:hypothetical protein